MKGIEMFRTFLICTIFIGFCLVPLASSEEMGDEMGDEIDNVTDEVVVDEEMNNVTEEEVVDEEMDNVTEELIVEEEMDNVTDGTGDLVAMIAADENLSALSAGIEMGNAEQLLALGGPYTIFAPSNEAFEALELDMDENESVENETSENESVENETVENESAENESTDNESAELVYILANHIVLGEYDSVALVGMAEENGTVQTLAGENLTLILDDEGGLMVGNVTVTMPDIEAENGLIHVVDGVILPENLSAEEEMPAGDEMVEEEVVEEEMPVEEDMVEEEPIEEEIVEEEPVEEMT
ncbi:putative surface protein with fasciclin (FAS1) repeats [Methanofollis sp. W23]|uniref:fasciclin domain-containing protein n=1 Tax=Methanofollis sp. W23 TaxID=2817849 RepID=UPI001AE1A35F|nr:fasciclin domain-containing protein [Methanofollis sp. W23]MBP2145309.1 putative surface protein with fasciclin (FAS1) repeats [Methanofollis sp. W23]